MNSSLSVRLSFLPSPGGALRAVGVFCLLTCAGCASLPIGGRVAGDGQSGVGNVSIDPNMTAKLDAVLSATANVQAEVAAVKVTVSKSTRNEVWPYAVGIISVAAVMIAAIRHYSYPVQKPIYEAAKIARQQA